MAATILWDDQEVPVLERGWQGETKPYQYVNRLKPGQKWSDAVISSNPQNRPATERYIQQPEGFVPPAVLAARELLAEGASRAVWTDCWSHHAVFMSPDLVCIQPEGELWDVLQKIKAALGNRWSGLPDAIAVFPDGRIVMREMKVAGKDKLQETQHAFARIARNLFPGRIEFEVVEWGRRPAESDLSRRWSQPRALAMTSSRHVYEVRPRKDKRGVDLISDALPFGRLWYGDPNAVSNAIGYAKFYSRSRDAVIRVYDEGGNVIETHEHAGDFKEP